MIKIDFPPINLTFMQIWDCTYYAVV